MTATLADRMRDRLGPAIGLAERAVMLQPAVYAVEEVAIARAVPNRQAEFRAGRVCARNAMEKIGFPPAAVPVGHDRAPVWPKGLVGSITHDAGFCLAAVALDRDSAGIGIDLTTDEPLPHGVLEHIARPEELARLAQKTADWQALIGRMLFAAKEATYKAVFPSTGIVWSFDALSVKIDAEAGTFLAETTMSAGPLSPGHRFWGHIVSKPGIILAGLTLPAKGSQWIKR